MAWRCFSIFACEKLPSLWCSLQLNVFWNAFGFYVKLNNSSRSGALLFCPYTSVLYNKTCWKTPASYMICVRIHLRLSHQKNKSLIHTQKAVQNMNLFGVTSSFPYPLPPLNLLQMFQTCQEAPCINVANHDQTDGGTIICWSLKDHWIKETIASFSALDQRKDVYIKPMNCWILSYKMAKKIGKVQQNPALRTITSLRRDEWRLPNPGRHPTIQKSSNSPHSTMWLYAEEDNMTAKWISLTSFSFESLCLEPKQYGIWHPELYI